MKKLYFTLTSLISLITLVSFGTPEKVIQIFKNGQVIQEYAVSDIDYIEINDKISAPSDISATINEDNTVTISWKGDSDAVFSIYRSADCSDFVMLEEHHKGNTYIDYNPLMGDNYYKVRALIGDLESEFSPVVYVDLKEPELNGFVNGHEYVDLGLPSGLRWATYNIGANAATENGDFFAWGEVTAKEVYNRASSLTYNMTDMSLSDVAANPDYDVARINWGGTWRMPSCSEAQELFDNCKIETITKGGITGYLFTGPNGQQIFIPGGGYFVKGNRMDASNATPYFWTSTPADYEGAFAAWGSRVARFTKWTGMCIRAVSDKENKGNTPTPIGIVSTVKNDKITISWGAHDDVTYNLYRSEDNKNFNIISGSLTTNSYTDTDLTPGTRYYYKVTATKNNQESGYSTVIDAYLPVKSSGAINGYDYIDLGLPSGIKWATRNVSSKLLTETTPLTENESFYAWGELSNKSEYIPSNSAFYGNSSIGTISGDSRYDVARAEWGGSWRIPAHTELTELYTQCVWKWIVKDDVCGYLVTGPNGNQVFFAAAGYRTGKGLVGKNESGWYWSSSPSGSNDNYTSASCLIFRSDTWGTYNDGPVMVYFAGRCEGLSVRAVSD